MIKVIFQVLLMFVLLSPLKIIGLYFMWNEVVAKAITWANPITWGQSITAVLCFGAIGFSLVFSKSE